MKQTVQPLQLIKKLTDHKTKIQTAFRLGIVCTISFKNGYYSHNHHGV